MGKYDLSKINIMSANDAATLRESIHNKERKELRAKNIKIVSELINKAIKNTEYKIELCTYPDFTFILPSLKNKGYIIEDIQGYETYRISWNENSQIQGISDAEFDIIPNATTAYTQTNENIKIQEAEAIYNKVYEINNKIKRHKEYHEISVNIDPQHYKSISEIFQKNGYKTKLTELHCPLGLYKSYHLIYVMW
ncbi:hypothetical protein PV-S19_0050 [Pacmanvirus S19]|nr:hypothetical protein PV-S19_0050 [Pacmanvirus S19]